MEAVGLENVDTEWLRMNLSELGGWIKRSLVSMLWQRDRDDEAGRERAEAVMYRTKADFEAEEVGRRAEEQGGGV
jgi:hypothetical protein